jgi:hypothetical protein
MKRIRKDQCPFFSSSSLSFESWRTPPWCFDYRSMTELLAFFFSLSPIHWEFCSTICLRCQLTWIQQGSGVQCNNDSPIFPSLDSSTQTTTNTHIFQPVARLTKRQAGSRHNTGYIIPFFLIVCREITDRPTHFWLWKKKSKSEIRILIWRWDWQTNGPHETVARAAAQQRRRL